MATATKFAKPKLSRNELEFRSDRNNMLELAWDIWNRSVALGSADNSTQRFVSRGTVRECYVNAFLNKYPEQSTYVLFQLSDRLATALGGQEFLVRNTSVVSEAAADFYTVNCPAIKLNSEQPARYHGQKRTFIPTKGPLGLRVALSEAERELRSNHSAMEGLAWDIWDSAVPTKNPSLKTVSLRTVRKCYLNSLHAIDPTQDTVSLTRIPIVLNKIMGYNFMTKSGSTSYADDGYYNLKMRKGAKSPRIAIARAESSRNEIQGVDTAPVRTKKSNSALSEISRYTLVAFSEVVKLLDECPPATHRVVASIIDVINEYPDDTRGLMIDLLNRYCNK